MRAVLQRVLHQKHQRRVVALGDIVAAHHRLASLLTDDLIQAVMRSDNVSQRDHAALMFLVKDTLEHRAHAWRPARALVDA